MMEHVFNLTELQQVAQEFWHQFPDATVIAFHGEMGAGKTTFIRSLCECKGVKDVISSPTFSIINEYGYNEKGEEHKIFHIDLYRLKSEEEAVQTGVADCFYSGEICLAEWPEQAPEIFPDITVHVYMEVIDSHRRKIRISKN